MKSLSISIHSRAAIKEHDRLCNGMALIVLLNIPCLLNKSMLLYASMMDISIPRMETIVDILAHL